MFYILFSNVLNPCDFPQRIGRKVLVSLDKFQPRSRMLRWLGLLPAHVPSEFSWNSMKIHEIYIYEYVILFQTISDYFQLQRLTLDASRSWCCHNIMRFHGDRFVVVKTPRASKSRNVRAVTPCQWVPWTELQSWVESAHWHPEKLLHLINLKSCESPHVYIDCDFPWLYLFHPFPVSQRVILASTCLPASQGVGTSIGARPLWTAWTRCHR